VIGEFSAEAPLDAAMKAEKAIEQKDFGRWARWKRILEMLADRYWPMSGRPTLPLQSIRFSNLHASIPHGNIACSES
jgi:hypothetical protein